MLKITLAAARVNAGYTQKEVAKELHKTPRTIGNWENGITFPDLNDLDALCLLYNVSKDCIILPKNLTKSKKEANENII